MNRGKSKITVVIVLVLVVCVIGAVFFLYKNISDALSDIKDAAFPKLPEITLDLNGGIYSQPDQFEKEETDEETEEETMEPVPEKPMENFEARIVDISGDGLTRQVTAELLNKMAEDVHNTIVKLEVTSGGSVIKLNGKEYLEVDLGTIKSGETVQSTMEISLGFFDGLKITQNGAVLYLTVKSDEVTETVKYEYQP
jgi:hypothetical protein